MLEYTESAYTTHTRNVRLVADHGGKIPKRWTELDTNLDAYRYRTRGWLHDLTQAVINGVDESEIRKLHALTLADAVGSVQGTAAGQAYGTAETMVDKQIENSVAAEMIKEYAAVADENLKLVGDQFSLNWVQFQKIAEQVNPDADAATLVGKPMNLQAAWMNAADLAAELDKGLVAVRAAAELVRLNLRTNDSLIGLVCPTTGTGGERRALWTAWDSDGRTGKWGALLKAGIEVKPIGSAREYRAYARPQMTNKVEPTGTGFRQTWVDSEDSEIKVHF
jgi:hypothetical protein